MNESWFVFYGHRMNMSREETMGTRYGEFLDLLACMAIEGGADQKAPKKSMEEILQMR